MTNATPVRSPQHEALEVFLGDWTAEGVSFGGGAPTPWTSTHTGRWHSGGFFLIQDERAQVDGPFDTLSILGWDEAAQRYFARTFENHGFTRDYAMTVEGNVWTITGETERARIEFTDGGYRQVIAWEWRPKGTWVPLCDRVATRV